MVKQSKEAKAGSGGLPGILAAAGAVVLVAGAHKQVSQTSEQRTHGSGFQRRGCVLRLTYRHLRLLHCLQASKLKQRCNTLTSQRDGLQVALMSTQVQLFGTLLLA